MHLSFVSTALGGGGGGGGGGWGAGHLIFVVFHVKFPCPRMGKNKSNTPGQEYITNQIM
jgi:hypothetical protein